MSGYIMMSYNSCSNLLEISQRIPLIVKFASKFSLGKRRVGYTNLYVIAPEFKRVLLYDVKSSLFFTISFHESLITDLQMYQMDIAVRFWNVGLVLLKQNILTHNFWEGQLLRIYLTVCRNLWVNLKRINCCNLQWMASMLIGMS